MTVKRLRHLVATLALIMFVPGGGSAALADTETDTVTDRPSAAVEPDPTTRAAEHQRRVEAGWLGEQAPAGARARISRANGIRSGP